ncbi:hypothetical protein DOY81_012622 [Sarcophaga bullata]|nr:hypothetical protein DOY81_012622 [Sarcophaga bullata]
MASDRQLSHGLSEATAIRLYNSVVATDEPNDRVLIVSQQEPQQPQATEQKSLLSMRSSNEFNHSCRICRWNRSDMELLKTPCLCRGSVGFIHLQCLRKWIMHRRDNRCEICNQPFNLPEEKFNFKRMFKSFWGQCAGPIMKHLLFSASLIPLTHIILQQVVICMENINLSPNDQLTVKEVILASSALMTSSALFFHIFEFITTRIILIRNILRHWWMFGNSSDFPLIELDSEILDLFD